MKGLEAQPYNMYHDETRFVLPNQPPVHAAFTAPQKNGFPKASESLVYFIDHDDESMRFAGQDAEKALACINAWYAANKDMDLTNATGSDRKRILKSIPNLKIVDGVLTIRHRDWNDLHEILEAAKIGLYGRPYVEDLVNNPLPTGKM